LAAADACSLSRAATSKWAHQSPADSANPRAEAITIGQEIGSSVTPIPIDTIDSPSATMMISPCRSAKCPAELTRQPLAPASIVPT
jgi:hypothetical protein